MFPAAAVLLLGSTCQGCSCGPLPAQCRRLATIPLNPRMALSNSLFERAKQQPQTQTACKAPTLPTVRRERYARDAVCEPPDVQLEALRCAAQGARVGGSAPPAVEGLEWGGAKRLRDLRLGQLVGFRAVGYPNMVQQQLDRPTCAAATRHQSCGSYLLLRCHLWLCAFDNATCCVATVFQSVMYHKP